ncbi:MAG: glycogen/starch/alpha-glucan phosphorylase [Oscillospiraceae bacterium]|nr:glycogen/starch/alpha-glucan phosphorylase [Oscillospiraceae bacterium]
MPSQEEGQHIPPKPRNTKLPHQIHDALALALLKEIDGDWQTSKAAHAEKRRAFYLSIEFLMGRAIYNNFAAVDKSQEAREILAEEGLEYLCFLEDIGDMALGNGGLGRLAACFLESAATHALPLDGYGIRYKYGLFKQTIEDGFQKEQPDNWLEHGDPWSVRVEDESVQICFADQTVKAVPYDMPIIGYVGESGKRHVGTLRLWQAEAENEFDFAAFDSGDYIGASSSKILAEDISRCLYPNDNTREGKFLRLKQEYFFAAASMKDALNKHVANNRNVTQFHEFNSVQLNDTHPVIATAELIRLLVDECALSFEHALDIAKKTFSYTNHTIMAEALEKWDVDYFKELLPRIYEIIIQINEALVAELYAAPMLPYPIESYKIVSGDVVHMARMAVYCSGNVNGVAEIHSEIIKNSVLKEWYAIYPEKFQNKTNGITPRRWLKLCNPELSTQITDLLGTQNWVRELNLLKGLEKYKDDNTQIERFITIKQQKKIQLAEYIQKYEGVKIDPCSIFDIQIKRFHEYKRQLLNAMGILYLYYEIKEGNVKDFYPTTFIFGGKSAPGYARAKGIIKYINEIGSLVNSDPQTAALLKVVFVQNYSVSYAEKLIPAADISEQISTAGTEASGTGNMKFMLNGAVTLGTYDGANIEIVKEAGEENNYIFGARVEELEEIMKTYKPRAQMAKFPKTARVTRSLIDGTVSDNGSGIFRELYFSLTDGASWHSPDNYYLLGDLESYIEARLKSNVDYKTDRLNFAKKCWLNISNAGKFSSDRTVLEYADRIWQVTNN